MDEIKIRGGAELDNALRAWPDKVQATVMRPGFRKAIMVVEREVNARAPVASAWHSKRSPGNLADSIFSKVRSRKGVLVAGVYFAARGYYWKFLERGTRKMRRRPFVAPAFNLTAPKALDVIAAEVRVGIVKLRRRATRALS